MKWKYTHWFLRDSCASGLHLPFKKAEKGSKMFWSRAKSIWLSPACTAAASADPHADNRPGYFLLTSAFYLEKNLPMLQLTWESCITLNFLDIFYLLASLHKCAKRTIASMILLTDACNEDHTIYLVVSTCSPVAYDPHCTWLHRVTRTIFPKQMTLTMEQWTFDPKLVKQQCVWQQSNFCISWFLPLFDWYKFEKNEG